ncbi:UNVERIFIED_CONTAM: hypothetical protein PYX00_002445 [Menopon gallinae]|uniref:Follicle cell protein 3C-1 n=1 Tax=Menopon gallinae TaxID=328185 RepID=A0AAW2IIC6_9NEOP
MIHFYQLQEAMESSMMTPLLASLIALSNAQLDTMRTMQNIALPTLMPLPSLPSLPTLSKNLPTLPGIQPFNAFLTNAGPGQNEMPRGEKVPCTCGVFLSGQFKRGSPLPPDGNAVFLQELTDSLQCNAVGEKHCINKCLETIVRHLPNSGPMICGSIDRDCFKERAYLFVKNCNDVWINSNLSAGREYCCKEGFPYKCPTNNELRQLAPPVQ